MHSPDSLDRWLRVLIDRGAADLFLVAGFPPAIRLNGVVTPLAEAPLESDDIEAAVLPSLHPQALDSYRSAGSADISLRRAGWVAFASICTASAAVRPRRIRAAAGQPAVF